MRNAFIDELASQAQSNQRIALIVGDLGYKVVEPFADEFPERFINVGVAEQNMLGLAAGMASEGYQVFVYSIANFPTFRCAEQIRNDVDYHALPVTVVAVGGGLAYGNMGYSHHAVQDYGLLRLLPNMLIAAPGDPMEVRACLRYLLANPQPSYLRLGKSGEKIIHAEVPELWPGKWLSIRARESSAGTYLTTGATLEFIDELFENTADLNHWSLNTMPLWGMKVKDMQVRQLEKYKQVLTIEDHLIDGGFGSWLMEAVCIRSDLLGRIRIKGLDAKVCGMVGKQASLNTAGGLTENLLPNQWGM